MATVERHTEISADFLHHAENMFREGDLLQASEKAWGAAAHCLKSIAERRGWSHGSHGALGIIVLRLADESDDPRRVRNLYRSVGMLHTNFYEDWLPGKLVEEGIDDARELIERLTRIG